MGVECVLLNFLLIFGGLSFEIPGLDFVYYKVRFRVAPKCDVTCCFLSFCHQNL
jgi:hypothetical protein